MKFWYYDRYRHGSVTIVSLFYRCLTLLHHSVCQWISQNCLIVCISVVGSLANCDSAIYPNIAVLLRILQHFPLQVQLLNSHSAHCGCWKRISAQWSRTNEYSQRHSLYVQCHWSIPNAAESSFTVWI